MSKFAFVSFHPHPAFQQMRIPIGIFVSDDNHTIKVRVTASKFPGDEYLDRPTEMLLESHVEDFQTVSSLRAMQNRGPHIYISPLYEAPDVDDLEAWLADMLP